MSANAALGLGAVQPHHQNFYYPYVLVAALPWLDSLKHTVSNPYYSLSRSQVTMQERKSRKRCRDWPCPAQQMTPGAKLSSQVPNLLLCFWAFAYLFSEYFWDNLPFYLFIQSHCFISIDRYLKNPNRAEHELLKWACELLKWGSRDFQVTRDKKPDSWSISFDWAAVSPFPHASLLYTARTEFVRPRQGGFNHFVDPKRSFLVWDSAWEPQTAPEPTEQPSCSTAGTKAGQEWGSREWTPPAISHS